MIGVDFHDVSATVLSPGDWYLGRGEWHLKVERVKHTEKRVYIEAVNGFGEGVRENYARRDLVTLMRNYRR